MPFSRGDGLPQLIVAMISSNMSRAGHPSRVTITRASTEGKQMGLQTDSVIMTDNLATIVEAEIDRIVGRCSTMQAVDDALRHTLAL